MLAKLFKAEMYKIIGNRFATGCLIWIFPLMAVALVGLLLFVVLVSAEARENLRAEPPLWTETMLGAWNIPNNPFGRLLLLGFTAVLFGGEYQWNTWKSIVPRSQRVSLLLIKFLAVGIFVVLAFGLTSILWAGGQWFVLAVIDANYGPAVNSEVLSDFAQDYALQAITTFVSVIIAAGYAAVAAIITRSILGSVVVGFVLTLAEGFSILALFLVVWLIGDERILHLYRLTPTYNLINVSTWVNEHRAAGFEMPSEEMIYDNLMFSLVILAIWMIGLIASTTFFFQQQDITN